MYQLAPNVLDASRSPLRWGPVDVLTLTGTFDPGSAERFASRDCSAGRIRPHYRSRFAGRIGRWMRSPSAALIHEKEPCRPRSPPESLCASSCPIVFASGKHADRYVRQAAIGVHQIYAAALSGEPQKRPARCRHGHGRCPIDHGRHHPPPCPHRRRPGAVAACARDPARRALLLHSRGDDRVSSLSPTFASELAGTGGTGGGPAPFDLVPNVLQ
jgi:hypothetical protein